VSGVVILNLPVVYMGAILSVFIHATQAALEVLKTCLMSVATDAPEVSRLNLRSHSAGIPVAETSIAADKFSVDLDNMMSG